MATDLPLDFANNVPWKWQYQIIKDGAPLDITGASLHMQLRADPAGDDIAIDMSTMNGFLSILDAPNGKWAFSVPIDRTGQVAAGSYMHDMIVILPNGDVHRPYKGNATVEQGVTRGGLPWQT